MTEVDTLVFPRWLLPVVPAERLLENCAVAVHEGEIIAIATAEDARKNFAAKHTLELPQALLMPGLINCHGHAAMSLLRGFADDYPLMTWLEEYIWPVEQAEVDAEFVSDGVELAMAEMLLSGTTTFCDQYFYPESSAQAARDAGMRAQIFFPVLDFPTQWANSADEYIQKGLQLADEYRSFDRVRIGFGPHAPYTVSDEPLKKIAMLAEEMQANIHIHLHETAFEVSEAEKNGQRPIARMQALGILGPHTQCVHMTQLNKRDMEILAATGAHVVHCPRSNLKLASGFCPSQTLLEKGINVALGTDGAASNNSLNLFSEMQFASLLGKGLVENAAAINKHQAIALATINGARALGIDDQVGSIEIGKRADIIAVDFSSASHTPIFDPVSHLVYANNGHNISHSWVDGQLLMDNYALTRMNLDAIKQKAQSWRNRL